MRPSRLAAILSRAEAPPPPGPGPAPESGVYRSTRNYLLQPVDVGSYASTLGGASYNADIWGPTRLYVDYQGGWEWAAAGGDVLATPAITAALNSAAGATPYTYSINVTTLVQAAETGARWLAIRVSSAGGARTIAGMHTAGVSAPSIVVTYSGGGSATLACRTVAYAGAGSSQPVSTAASYSLPVFMEFDRPTGAVASATLSFTVTIHWSGNSTATIQLLDPPRNTAPDTATGAGLAASADVLDDGLSSVSGVIGVHRYVDGATLSDFVVAPGLNFGSGSNYSQEFWGGSVDTSKWPYNGAGKWVVLTGTASPALVASSYSGEGFTPLATGLGALKLTMADENPATGAEVGNNGTLATNMKLFMPPAHFGTLGHIFVRYYVRLGTPYAPTAADRVEVRQSGSPAWTNLSGKWGINAAHETSFGGVSGTSGGGYGWQMRGSWADCEAGQNGPAEEGITVGHHLFDFQSNNPVGHRYGSEQPFQFERWGQLGGQGATLYAGRWYLVEQELKLNTIDTGVGTYGSDGELRTWLDGRLVFERTGMVFRTAPIHAPAYDPSKLRPCLQLGVKELWLNWFHGGQTVSTYPRTMFVTGLAYGTSRIGAMKPAASALPAWASQISSNDAWLPITGASSFSVWANANIPNPAPGFIGTNWINAIVNSYGSPAYDSANEVAYLWNGGHANGSYNGVIKVNLSALHASPYSVAVQPTPSSAYPPAYVSGMSGPPGIRYPSGADDGALFGYGDAATFHATFRDDLTNPADTAYNAPEKAPASTHGYAAFEYAVIAGVPSVTIDYLAAARASLTTGRWVAASSSIMATRLNALGLANFPLQQGTKSHHDSVSGYRFATCTPGDDGISSRNHILRIDPATHNIVQAHLIPTWFLGNAVAMCAVGRKLWLFNPGGSTGARTFNTAITFDMDTYAVAYYSLVGTLGPAFDESATPPAQESVPCVGIGGGVIARWYHGADRNAMYLLDTTPTAGAGTPASPYTLTQTRRALGGSMPQGTIRHYRLIYSQAWGMFMVHHGPTTGWYALKLS